jgi:hypothetical protein
VQERAAEELRADGATCAAIGDLLEEARDAVLSRELSEAIHGPARGRRMAVALAARRL